MNTLTTIAVWLAGSAVLQMVGFYCYSSYQKSRLLKSFTYEGVEDEKIASLHKPGGKIYAAGLKEGGKIASIYPSHSNTASTFNHSKSKSENLLLKQVAQ